MSDIADNYLLDLGALLRERALEAKERCRALQTTEQQAFESGRQMAYYEVIALMLSQAEAFRLPVDKLALQGMDVDRDLLG